MKILRPLIKKGQEIIKPEDIAETIEELKKKIDELEDKLNEGNGDDTNGPK